MQVFNPPDVRIPRDWDEAGPFSEFCLEQQIVRHRKLAMMLSRKNLPPELIRRIFWLAGEGCERCVTTETHALYSNDANHRYLRTPPLQSPMTHHFVMQVTVETDSHDQGWSSEPRREWLGTYEGSHTWWDLTLDRPAPARAHSEDRLVTVGASSGSDSEADDPPACTWHEIHRVEVCRNIHASQSFKLHNITLGPDHPLVRDAQPGDVISLWARTQYPGWVNNACYARIRVRVAWG